ncbi:SIS domain-containing protein [Paramicrobacterium agarici]|uniref:SIS domain-containing protein n=1 Tax=Paramicrobacterium agarici TaxID=630514 RepID=UPI0011542BD6|nr:hypothetical protein [Microbacterium agarici]TQO22924.1 glucosamine--fructose-6-phosphate aminotransferase (isomerizing) [Microbacterium agarici]
MAHQAPWITFEEALERQPKVLSESISASREWVDTNVALFSGKRLLFAGIGASHAAIATPVFVLRQHGVQALRSACSDLPNGTPQLADLYVGVSQSGRSRETVQALLSIERSRRVAVVNRLASPLADQAAHVFGLGGVVDSQLSSIAFTATLAGLGMLAEKVSTNDIGSGWDELGLIIEDNVARADATLLEFAEQIVGRSSVDVVATAANLSAAEQGALLLREGPWVPSTYMDTRSYLHGPMDSTGSTSAHIVIGGKREGLLVDQLLEKSAPVLFFASDGASANAPTIAVPDLTASQAALLQVALLQRLTLHVTKSRKKNIQDRAFTRLDTKVDSVEQVITGTY